ncbi:hypothetical protein HXX76_008699 [Chlamydomonas incerta]|uniref:Protein kinase domain-containing protein n=1 Tax=Chlamydomonas incerta TaxID=51695 RepID=A0A835W1T7_CHLIN|nr:hypothetical protein HXX76_008699 [Chlamydomonas incerta]|eukprot:KAG2432971.1 hypothetical protein HXX76_008699 [Chlamydomonas incerta]
MAGQANACALCSVDCPAPISSKQQAAASATAAEQHSTCAAPPDSPARVQLAHSPLADAPLGAAVLLAAATSPPLPLLTAATTHNHAASCAATAAIVTPAADAIADAPPAPITAPDLPPATAAAAAALDAMLPAADGTPQPTAAGSAGTSSARRRHQLLLASRQRDLEAEQVVECDPAFILDGLSMSSQQLGRGSFGTVVSGAYHGLPCAGKVVVADSLDSSAVSELLLAPSMNHAHLVQTYTTRCAVLTHDFFDLLEGGSSLPPVAIVGDRHARDPRLPRLLQPITSVQSGDGFGDPGGGIVGVRNPYVVLHGLLYEYKANVGQRVLVIVQELCTKSTLHNAIRRNTFKCTPQWNLRLARRALLRTAVEMARGLLHLHEMGVVHGDVKPQNVLLASSRDDRRGFKAKVADFGLAHVLPLAASSVMNAGSNGSPAYMAPEAFQGSVSRASDVWSFGVCLHEMLTGARPFSDVPAANAEVLVAAIRAGRVRLVWPDERLEMAEGIIAIGKRCMSAEPEDRPGFREIIEELVNTERIIRAEALAPVVMARVAAQMEHAALAAMTPQERGQRVAEALARVGIPLPDPVTAPPPPLLRRA